MTTAADYALPSPSQCLAIPTGLTRKGRSAAQAILRVMARFEATNLGGCRAFYAPAAWKKRGEEYGLTSELIVVYDGGDLVSFFSRYSESMTRPEAMREELAKIGLWVEPCTCWYSALYVQ